MQNFSFSKVAWVITLAFFCSVNLQAATQSKPVSEVKITSQQKEDAVKTRLTFKERIALKIGKYVLSKYDNVEVASPAQGRTEILGVISLGSAVLGLLVSGIFTLGAIVLGIISLVKFGKRPGEFNGKGFAWAGLILGALTLLLFVAAVIIVF